MRRPPSHRHDLELPEDLSEEVARIAGYEEIPLAGDRIGRVDMHAVDQRVGADGCISGSPPSTRSWNARRPSHGPK